MLFPLTSQSIIVSITSQEETYEPSIEYLPLTPSAHGKETLGINEEPFLTSKYKPATVSIEDASFQDSGARTNCEVIGGTSLKKYSPKIEVFDYSSYEARILKAASEITIIDSKIFGNHSKLDLSYIHRKSQDDWSHNSEYTDNFSLDNWADNSGLLDETLRDFYLQVLEPNLYLISAIVISITTHLILLYTSTTSSFLAKKSHSLFSH